jgi:hypothetical protein
MIFLNQNEHFSVEINNVQLISGSECRYLGKNKQSPVISDSENITFFIFKSQTYTYLQIQLNFLTKNTNFPLFQDTFDDTVFAENKTNSFLIEFYADWCGYCRAFAPFYRDLSWQIQDWSDVSIAAAINCADFHNFQVCRDNGISTFPQLKVDFGE